MPEETPSQRSLPLRWLIAFGMFWWDFLVGDTPEITVAILVVLGVVAVLTKEVSTTLGWVALPVLVIGTYTATVFRARRAS